MGKDMEGRLFKREAIRAMGFVAMPMRKIIKRTGTVTVTDKLFDRPELIDPIRTSSQKG